MKPVEIEIRVKIPYEVYKQLTDRYGDAWRDHVKMILKHNCTEWTRYQKLIKEMCNE